MKILLIELETKGHHITSYLKSIINNLQKNNHKIYLLTTKLENKKIIDFKNKVKIFYIKKNRNMESKNYFHLFIVQLKNYFKIKKKFDKIIKKNQIDCIYLNNIDHFDKVLSIFGSPFRKIIFFGLFLNPKILHNEDFNILNFFKISIYKYLFSRLLNIKTLKKVFIVNPLCYKQVPKNKVAKIKLLNEIGTFSYKNKISLSKNNCKKFLNIKKTTFVILVYGAIREEKELIYLINVIKKFYYDYKMKIIIAGQQDAYTKKILIENVHNNVIKKKFLIINKYVNERLEQILFKASDLVWPGYSKNFRGSSGVFFLSSMNKVPVITSNHGLIYWHTKKYKIGISTDLRNPNKVRKVINYFFNNRGINFHNKFKKTNNIHNSDNFSKQIESCLTNNKNTSV
jgi:glycosyltransferase involved in cell wall biosynthesis